MVSDPSQTGSIVPNQDSSATLATAPKQALPRGWQANTPTVAVEYSAYTISKYCSLRERAVIYLKRYGFAIRENEMIVLLAFHAFILQDYTGNGVISIEGFIKDYHGQAGNQNRIHGAFYGLIDREYLQVFEQRKNGTRYAGITPYGAKLIEVYYSILEKLFARAVVRRTRVDHSVKRERFISIDKHAVGNLYTSRMTTLNKHLYDRTKYYHADGSLKD